MTAEAERARVSQHILQAQRLAHAADVSHLDPLRALTRELLLTELSAYRAQGRFPKNAGQVADRTPIFVDVEGTRCAMAHLLELGGQADLVAKIATERNYARVKELADEALLLAWLDAAGLTVEEAAAIQPTYECLTPAEYACGLGEFTRHTLPVPAKAVLQVVVLPSAEVEVTQVFGQTPLRVGDRLTFTREREPTGAKLIIALSESDAEVIAGSSANDLRYAPLDASEQFICDPDGFGNSDAPGLSTEGFSKLAFADDCLTEARKLPGFEATSCDDDEDGTCSVTTGSQLSLEILLAIAGVLLRRKVRRKST